MWSVKLCFGKVHSNAWLNTQQTSRWSKYACYRNQGEKYIIHKRQVYNLMDFLGDAGGVYGSMMIVG